MADARCVAIGQQMRNLLDTHNQILIETYFRYGFIRHVMKSTAAGKRPFCSQSHSYESDFYTRSTKQVEATRTDRASSYT